jgi:hypothetical protein
MDHKWINIFDLHGETQEPGHQHRRPCPDREEILHVEIKDRNVVGEKIGAKSARRRQNEHSRLHHLHVHNLFGKIYLFFVVPFHRYGVKTLLRNAVAAGRL